MLPVGDTEQWLNWYYQGGALNTYGLDVGYFIIPELNASVGYYYQSGDLGTADGSGVLGRLAYEITSGLTAGVNLSYDKAFEARVSADVEYRFGGPSKTVDKNKAVEFPAIKALSSSPSHRDARVHDDATDDLYCVQLNFLVDKLYESSCVDYLKARISGYNKKLAI